MNATGHRNPRPEQRISRGKNTTKETREKSSGACMPIWINETLLGYISSGIWEMIIQYMMINKKCKECYFQFNRLIDFNYLKIFFKKLNFLFKIVVRIFFKVGIIISLKVKLYALIIYKPYL